LYVPDAYNAENVDKLVAGAVALAHKHVKSYSETERANLVYILVASALEQEDFGLLKAIGEHAPVSQNDGP
jgi:hypothetical protein